MNKSEFIELTSLIESYYPGRFRNDERIAKTWWAVLKDHEFTTCQRNLKKHVTVSEFPPTIANLIAGAQDSSRVYAQDLADATQIGPSTEEFIEDLERRTGKRVVRNDF